MMFALSGLFAFMVLLFATPVAATLVVPITLPAMVDAGASIFEGICESSVESIDPALGVLVTHTTFRVSEAIKGDIGKRHTLKQFGGHRVAGASRPMGAPEFVPGQRYLVLVYGVSDKGFSSPVGLTQGRFFVREEAGRPLVAGNGRDFRKLLPEAARAHLPARALARLDAAGPVHEMDLDDLKATIRHFAGSTR